MFRARGRSTDLTPTRHHTVQETSTIIWFPPTDTPRPVVTPTLLPTRNLHPGVGTQVFSDLFTKDSNWQVASDDSGSIAYGNNELTLAIRQPKVTMATLNRTLYMGDFYLEVTANPSLCRGMDAYGLLLRLPHLPTLPAPFFLQRSDPPGTCEKLAN